MIYLDYNASTPVDPAVREAMWPYLGEYYGNPSSGHIKGREVSKAVSKAREQVASLLGAAPKNIVFTSGGTEANNLTIKGVAHSLRGRGRHIITSVIEHPAVLIPCRFLAQSGYEVSYVGVDSTGLIDLQAIADEIRPDTILISIMHANNEVGTIQPIAEIAGLARERNILIHTDAAQSCGKIETRVSDLGVDFLSVAGHKLYAPQGIGALFIRSGIEIEPLHHGAGHENGRRAGTEPVPAIVGLGVAAELAEQQADDAVIIALRDRLHRGLQSKLGDRLVLLGHPHRRLPNTLAVGLRGHFGADLLAKCPDICASTGSACHSGTREKSAVLAAMNTPDDVAFGGVRLSVGRFTTEAEIDEAVTQLVAAASESAIPPQCC
ncbi:MAG: cysteine desulfurase [Phycisphaerales bacterium]|nr:MAG: cysteine desulfurase [Phycisphaerales bacterium]